MGCITFITGPRIECHSHCIKSSTQSKILSFIMLYGLVWCLFGELANEGIGPALTGSLDTLQTLCSHPPVVSTFPLSRCRLSVGNSIGLWKYLWGWSVFGGVRVFKHKVLTPARATCSWIVRCKNGWRCFYFWDGYIFFLQCWEWQLIINIFCIEPLNYKCTFWVRWHILGPCFSWKPS